MIYLNKKRLIIYFKVRNDICIIYLYSGECFDYN